jgi:hypothetical protein
VINVSVLQVISAQLVYHQPTKLLVHLLVDHVQEQLTVIMQTEHVNHAQLVALHAQDHQLANLAKKTTSCTMQHVPLHVQVVTEQNGLPVLANVRTIVLLLTLFIVNRAPTAKSMISEHTIYDDEAWEYTVELESDLDTDTVDFTLKLLSSPTSTTALTKSWFSVTGDTSTYIKFKVDHPSGFTNPVSGDTYYVNITLDDNMTTSVYTI